MQRTLLLPCLMSIALVAVGCGDDDNNNNDRNGVNDLPDAEANGAMAQIRVVHSAPDAPEVDVYIEGDDQPIIDDLGYGSASEYLQVPAGNYNLLIRPGDAAPDSDPVYETGSIELAEGARVTAVAAGLLETDQEDQSFRVLPLAEEFEPAANGTARVRVVHASPDAPTVDIDVGADGSAEITGLERFEATGAEGVELPAGEMLDIAILSDDVEVAQFTTPELSEMAELFLVATGLLDAAGTADDAFSLLVVDEDGSAEFIRQNPTLYALHASPDAPAVDVFTNDQELISNLSFGEISSPLHVRAGEYSLDFFGTDEGTERPEGDPVVEVTTPELETGRRYLAIATGLLEGSPGFQLIALEDEFRAEPDGDGDNGDAGVANQTPRVRVVHASPDAPEVDVGTVSEGALEAPEALQGLSFGDASPGEGVELPEGDVQLGVAAAGTEEPLFVFPFTATAGQRAFVVAAGAVDEALGETFRLLTVDTTETPWTVSETSPEE